MEKGEREEIERAFVESDDEGSVLDAFLALLPTEEESFAAASSSAPQKFVKKLQDINPTFHVREQNPSGCWGFAHRSSLHSRFRRVGSFA